MRIIVLHFPLDVFVVVYRPVQKRELSLRLRFLLYSFLLPGSVFTQIEGLLNVDSSYGA